MRKLLICCAAVLLLAAAAAVGAAAYMRPGTPLDLSFEPVPLDRRALDMVKRFSTEMVLSEADVNHLAKQAISQNPETDSGAIITGAQFRLAGDRVEATVDVRIKDRLPAELRFVYRLEWREPVLTAAVEEARLKDVPLPTRYFEDVAIPLGDLLPKPLHVQSIRVDGSRLIVQFRKPTMQELGDLLKSSVSGHIIRLYEADEGL